MPDRSITIAALPTTDGGEIELRLSFTAGGPNYATFGTTPRGYFLHCQPQKVEVKNGFRCVSFGMFSGIKKLIEGADRFGQKRLEALAAGITASDYAPLVAPVCAHARLTLSDGPVYKKVSFTGRPEVIEATAAEALAAGLEAGTIWAGSGNSSVKIGGGVAEMAAFELAAAEKHTFFAQVEEN